MCCLRVSGFLTEITQQIHSLRASAVISSHFARAAGSEMRTFRKSAGTVCAASAEIAFLVTLYFTSLRQPTTRQLEFHSDPQGCFREVSRNRAIFLAISRNSAGGRSTKAIAGGRLGKKARSSSLVTWIPVRKSSIMPSSIERVRRSFLRSSMALDPSTEAIGESHIPFLTTFAPPHSGVRLLSCVGSCPIRSHTFRH